MNFNRLAYVMLGSGDLERSLRFYGGVLGMQQTARFGDFAFFDAGGVTLVVTGELTAPSESQPTSCEVVFGVDSVGEAYRTFKERIAFANEPRMVNADNWAVNFNDPDGHALSFYGPP